MPVAVEAKIGSRVWIVAAVTVYAPSYGSGRRWLLVHHDRGRFRLRKLPPQPVASKASGSTAGSTSQRSMPPRALGGRLGPIVPLPLSTTLPVPLAVPAPSRATMLPVLGRGWQSKQ